MSSGKKWFEHFANTFSGHQQSGRRESWVGYHLSKSFDNFGWNANGKAILVSPNGKFPMFLELLKRWSKISMLLETLVQTKGSSSLRELRDNLAIHGDWGVLSTSTISRHVRTKLPKERLGKCASKLIYCKRHVFSCQTVDKSATIICVSGAKTYITKWAGKQIGRAHV